jgi:hypothetical protein
LKYCKIEDIANKERGKNIVRKRGSKLFELYSPIDEIIVKGSKLFQSYLLEGSQKHNEGVEALKTLLHKNGQLCSIEQIKQKSA